MTIAVAIEYLPRRMRQLGYGADEYYFRFRHLVLQPLETVEFEFYKEFFLLVEDISNVNIESYTGMFDLDYPAINELQYEHQGLVTVKNKGDYVNHVHFIQVIPKTKINDGRNN